MNYQFLSTKHKTNVTKVRKIDILSLEMRSYLGSRGPFLEAPGNYWAH